MIFTVAGRNWRLSRSRLLRKSNEVIKANYHSIEIQKVSKGSRAGPTSPSIVSHQCLRSRLRAETKTIQCVALCLIITISRR